MELVIPSTVGEFLEAQLMAIGTGLGKDIYMLKSKLFNFGTYFIVLGCLSGL